MADSKTKATKLSPKEKRAAKLEANRKARQQWLMLGIGLAVIAIAVIVLISVFTEGSLPIQQGVPEP